MEQKENLRDPRNQNNLQLTAPEARNAQLPQGNPAGEPAARSGPAGDGYAEYRSMLSQRQERVPDPRVVYQGEPGAYSEMAARKLFGAHVRAAGLNRFEDPFLALRRGEADYAVLPVENSCTGAIRQVYALLAQYPCFLVGETAVPVHHALMALPGTGPEEITTVYSHEQGLQQCARFLDSHPHWKQVPQADTAGSARMVAERGDRHIAAICSALAAEIYGLEILQERVNTESDNTTRFLVLSSRAELWENRNRICVAFTTVNHPDALQQSITVLNAHGLRLRHLESRPVPGRSWAYLYFLEFSGDLLKPDLDGAIRALFRICPDFRVLGNFHSEL